MKILVVDDSSAARSLISRMLVKQGHVCVTAQHGREALERLAVETGIELALVDWNMPTMDGLEFVQAVRAGQSQADLLMVMVTSESDISNVVRALEAGANEYLMKPFTDVELASKIEITLAARNNTP